ncbi:hypothetical protein MNBD_ALPHA09-2189 [hydrothermal vent metagenome]|uniref:DUF3108 domain-containing protein n=1 Tax=hydrothermal vent metagenome TaxID=652676 RepID=A0A3B0SVD2_9ZZZZ
MSDEITTEVPSGLTGSRTRQKRLMCRLALASAALLTATAVNAQTIKLSAADLSRLDQKIELDYNVLGLGFSVLSAKFDITLNRRKYKATSVIKTEGIAGLIMRSRWDSVSEGRITRAGLRPTRFRTDVSTSRGRGAVNVKFEKNSYLISAVPKIQSDRRAGLNAKLTPNLPDPLSALVTTAIFNSKNPCTGKARVFDGRRIFDLAFQFDKQVTITGNRTYSGPAYACLVKHTPVAGQPAAELKAEQQSPSPFHRVWLAPVKLGAKGLKALIPVRIDLQTGWTTTTIALTRSSIGGRPITVAAR